MSITLVSGASGGVGVSLVNKLLDAGYPVVGFDIKDFEPYDKADLKEYIDNGKLKLELIDITNANMLESKLSAHEPYDNVYHLAGDVAFLSIMHDAVNAWGTKNILEYCSKKGVLTDDHKFFNTSTASLYNTFRVEKKLFGYKKIECPMPENGYPEVHPIGRMEGFFRDYTMSKLYAEFLGHEFRGLKKQDLISMLSDPRYYKDYRRIVGTPNIQEYLNVITNRFAMVYPSRELSGDIMNMVELGLGRLISVFMPDFPVGFVSTNNITDFLMHLYNLKPKDISGKIYNVSEYEPISFSKIAELVGRELKKPWKSVLTPDIQVRELLMYAKMLNHWVTNLGIHFAMDGLHIYKLMEHRDILGNHVFDISEALKTGWEPVDKVEEKIGSVARDMKRKGLIGWGEDLRKVFSHPKIAKVFNDAGIDAAKIVGKMYDRGEIGNLPGLEKILDMIPQFMIQFELNKYKRYPDLAKKNKKVGRRGKNKKWYNHYMNHLDQNKNWNEHYMNLDNKLKKEFDEMLNKKKNY